MLFISDFISGAAEEFSASYWQCFPREVISLTFIDMGHSAQDAVDDDTLADLRITAYVQPGVFHEYSMSKLMPADEYEMRLHLWRTLRNTFVWAESLVATVKELKPKKGVMVILIVVIAIRSHL